MSELYSLLLCLKGTCVHLILPPHNYWHSSPLFLARPCPLHEIALSTFSRSPLGRVRVCEVLSLLLTSHISLNVFPFHLLFNATSSIYFCLSVLLRLSCNLQTSPWTVIIFCFLLFPPIPYRIRYPTLPSSPFHYFLPYSPISYGWQPLLVACSLLYTPKYILRIQFYLFSFCFQRVRFQLSRYCIAPRTWTSQYVLACVCLLYTSPSPRD